MHNDSSYKNNPWNEDTSLIRTVVCVPVVSTIERFHSTLQWSHTQGHCDGTCMTQKIYSQELIGLNSSHNNTALLIIETLPGGTCRNTTNSKAQINKNTVFAWSVARATISFFSTEVCAATIWEWRLFTSASSPGYSYNIIMHAGVC